MAKIGWQEQVVEPVNGDNEPVNMSTTNRKETSSLILEAIAENNEITYEELAELLNVSRATV